MHDTWGYNEKNRAMLWKLLDKLLEISNRSNFEHIWAYYQRLRMGRNMQLCLFSTLETFFFHMVTWN